jgi:Ca2+-binding RTX toxin-like protein
MRGHRRDITLMQCVGIAALCVFALSPAVVLAATANTRIKRVFYTAAPGEVNNLTVSLAGAEYVLDDPGATITTAPACLGLGPSVTCSAAGIIGITVSAGDGADSVTNTTATRSTLSGGDGNDSLAGGSGNDILRGNKGVDTHAGGAGDDLIDARGDRGDIVSCGNGNDTVKGDVADSIALDCETVDRGIVPPPPPGAPPPPPGAPPPPPGPGPAPPSPSAAALLGPAETRALDPGACASDMVGTPGNDRLAGTALGDNLLGLQGDDILEGLQGDDCAFGGVGSDRLSGAQGDDRLLGDDSTTGVGGNDRLSGSAGDDLLVGGDGKDRLAGGRGKDRLAGGPGRNRLLGGSGNDRLRAANGRFDRVNCGSGRDFARVDRVDRVRGCERVRVRR